MFIMYSIIIISVADVHEVELLNTGAVNQFLIQASLLTMPQEVYIH